MTLAFAQSRSPCNPLGKPSSVECRATETKNPWRRYRARESGLGAALWLPMRAGFVGERRAKPHLPDAAARAHGGSRAPTAAFSGQPERTAATTAQARSDPGCGQLMGNCSRSVQARVVVSPIGKASICRHLRDSTQPGATLALPW